MKRSEPEAATRCDRRQFIGDTAMAFCLFGFASRHRATWGRNPRAAIHSFLRGFSDRAPALAHRLRLALPPAELNRLTGELHVRLADRKGSVDHGQLREEIREWVRADFLSSRIVTCDSVVLSETEAALLASGAPEV
jgi:hypothetical protein